MVDLEHQVSINAEPAKVYAAISTSEGNRGWWTADSTVEAVVGTSSGDCCRGRRNKARRKAQGHWRAVPLALLAAAIPKCPFCLAALLGALGLTSVAHGLALHVNDRDLAAVSVAALVATIAIFAVRRSVVDPLRDGNRRDRPAWSSSSPRAATCHADSAAS